MKFIKNIFDNIKKRYGIVVPTIITVFTLISLIASVWISTFIYEPSNIAEPFYLFSVIFFPFTSIIIGIILVIKFIIDAILKKEGSHLKTLLQV